jgi:hypothetical protein
MYIRRKSVALGAITLISLMTVANADPASQPNVTGAVEQIAQAVPSVKLPEVVVHPHPESWYYSPYTDGHGPRPSSENNIKSEHFKVPVGYDADVTMHPYTSYYGPCPEGGKDPCSRPAQSHYERPPFNQ